MGSMCLLGGTQCRSVEVSSSNGFQHCKRGAPCRSHNLLVPYKSGYTTPLHLNECHTSILSDTLCVLYMASYRSTLLPQKVRYNGLTDTLRSWYTLRPKATLWGHLELDPPWRRLFWGLRCGLFGRSRLPLEDHILRGQTMTRT